MVVVVGANGNDLGIIAVGDMGEGRGIVISTGGVDSRPDTNVEAIDSRSGPLKFDKFDGRRVCEGPDS